MHRNISRVSPIVGKVNAGRTKGITGFVYRSVRGVTRLVGVSLDVALTKLNPLLSTEINKRIPLAQREAVLAALNGVLGDYLVATNNALAIPIQLRQHGEPLQLTKKSLEAQFKRNNGRLLILVHGLCMNDLQWAREGHDHGVSLAADLGYTPLYLHYNSGQHVSTNGKQFAETLESLNKSWPVPIKEMVIIGHSMGGLVSRSACHYAKQSKHTWPKHLKKLFFLGTPHHGAPLERAGNWLDILLGISPYSEPLARLGMVRSAGITDLRYGNLLDEDWSRRNGEARTAVPLPKGVKCFAIAATMQQEPKASAKRLLGDGLVQVRSALGEHADGVQTIAISSTRKKIFFSTNHFEILSSTLVCDQLYDWLT
jgi:pimeloyl-ACP methyl ester carboxylesterase